MLLDADDSQLVLIDYQVRLMPVIFENERVVGNAVRLARMARLMDVPVWGTAQNPEKLGQNLPEVQAAIDEAGGKTLAKMHFSAAGGLVECLRQPVRKAPTARSMIVIGGCEAHVCLMQTALQLLEEAFDVWVVTDACSSRSVHNRDAAFARLARKGAELVTTEMVAFEWARTCEHPAFRDLLGLVTR